MQATKRWNLGFRAGLLVASRRKAKDTGYSDYCKVCCGDYYVDPFPHQVEGWGVGSRRHPQTPTLNRVQGCRARHCFCESTGCRVEARNFLGPKVANLTAMCTRNTTQKLHHATAETLNPFKP